MDQLDTCISYLVDKKLKNISGRLTQIVIVFLDKDFSEIELQYDSHKKAPKGKLGFYPLGTLSCFQTGKLREESFLVNDAFFGGRCNGSDLRAIAKGDNDIKIYNIYIKELE